MIDLSNKAMAKNKAVNKTKKINTAKVSLPNNDYRKNKKENSVDTKYRTTSDFLGSSRFLVFIISTILFLISFGCLFYLIATSESIDYSTHSILLLIAAIVNFIIAIIFSIDLFKMIPKNDLEIDDSEDRVNYSYIRIFSVTKLVGAVFSFIVLITISVTMFILMKDLTDIYLKDKTIFKFALWFTLLLNTISLVVNTLSFWESKFNRGILNE